jgi:NAD(P)-dependent dehydrogenase (short-subunit alcohol dehydrogenase family)
MSNQKVVLVTGASSGNGRATARLLSQEGYKVFGTSRNPSSAGPMPDLEMVALDVCDDDSVAACVKAVSDRVGHLDVLVNNAGYELAGALEEVSLDEAKAQFETNFFGVVRMVKAVLPLMRRQEGGQIINISSLAGLSPIPFMGIYSASKFALEGYTEVLRLEVQPLNIHVSQIEAGFLKTPMPGHRQIATEQIGAYEPWRQRALDAIRAYEEEGPGPELVAETVLRIVASSKPHLRYVIGQQAKRVSRLRRFLPEGVFQNGSRSTFRLDGSK